MTDSESKPNSIWRIIAIAAVILAFVGLIIVSNSQKRTAVDKVWDMRTTVGDSEQPKLLYVMYTDLFCPYCDVFSRAVMENWDEFTAFLDEHHILFEVRLTDMLYQANGYITSRDAAEATYCAREEDKFWEYYHAAIQALWDDYQSKGIGSNSSAEPITNLPEDYWLKIGHAVGLGDTFDQCVDYQQMADAVNTATLKAAQISTGMPTFVFGDFTTSGFSDTWGWDEAKLMLSAGLGNN